MRYGALLAAAAALTVTACGGTAASHSAQSGNVRVCQHYRIQRAKLLSTATPTLATAAQVVVWVTADAAQAAPGTPLARDLRQMLTAMRHGADTSAAISRVHADCQALGVKIG